MKRDIAFNPKVLREIILDMAYAGSTVHIGCAFSIVEILAILYRDYLRYPNNQANNPNRDYLVLSKGHGVMAQYACMRELGWLTEDAIRNYFSDGSVLMGLSDSRVDGLEVTSGSLGHGLSIGVGLALAAKLTGTDQKTYIVVGDGELNEGAVWEGLMFAAHSELKNLMVIVDENGFQAMGTTDEVISMGDLGAKFRSFGFEALSVDGHSEPALKSAIDTLWSCDSKSPKVLIAKTVKGKGVSFMENNNLWHYTRLTAATYTQAIAEIKIGL